jgi:hypothetical protein
MFNKQNHVEAINTIVGEGSVVDMTRVFFVSPDS